MKPLAVAALLLAATATAQERLSLAPGTVLLLEMGEPISTETSFATDEFSAAVMAARDAEGEPLEIDRSLRVQGAVSAVVSADNIGAIAQLVLRFDRLIDAVTGQSVPVGLALVAFVPEGDDWRVTTVAGGTVIIDRLRFTPRLAGLLVDESRGVALAGLAAGRPATLVAPAPGYEIALPAGAVIPARLPARAVLPPARATP